MNFSIKSKKKKSKILKKSKKKTNIYQKGGTMELRKLPKQFIEFLESKGFSQDKIREADLTTEDILGKDTEIDGIKIGDEIKIDYDGEIKTGYIISANKKEGRQHNILPISIKVIVRIENLEFDDELIDLKFPPESKEDIFEFNTLRDGIIKDFLYTQEVATKLYMAIIEATEFRKQSKEMTPSLYEAYAKTSLLEPNTNLILILSKLIQNKNLEFIANLLNGKLIYNSLNPYIIYGIEDIGIVATQMISEFSDIKLNTYQTINLFINIKNFMINKFDEDIVRNFFSKYAIFFKNNHKKNTYSKRQPLRFGTYTDSIIYSSIKNELWDLDLENLGYFLKKYNENINTANIQCSGYLIIKKINDIDISIDILDSETISDSQHKGDPNYVISLTNEIAGKISMCLENKLVLIQNVPIPPKMPDKTEFSDYYLVATQKYPSTGNNKVFLNSNFPGNLWDESLFLLSKEENSQEIKSSNFFNVNHDKNIKEETFLTTVGAFIRSRLDKTSPKVFITSQKVKLLENSSSSINELLRDVDSKFFSRFKSEHSFKSYCLLCGEENTGETHSDHLWGLVNTLGLSQFDSDSNNPHGLFTSTKADGYHQMCANCNLKKSDKIIKLPKHLLSPSIHQDLDSKYDSNPELFIDGIHNTHLITINRLFLLANKYISQLKDKSPDMIDSQHLVNKILTPYTDLVRMIPQILEKFNPRVHQEIEELEVEEENLDEQIKDLMDKECSSFGGVECGDTQGMGFNESVMTPVQTPVQTQSQQQGFNSAGSPVFEKLAPKDGVRIRKLEKCTEKKIVEIENDCAQSFKIIKNIILLQDKLKKNEEKLHELRAITKLFTNDEEPRDSAEEEKEILDDINSIEYCMIYFIEKLKQRSFLKARLERFKRQQNLEKSIPDSLSLNFYQNIGKFLPRKKVNNRKPTDGYISGLKSIQNAYPISSDNEMELEEKEDKKTQQGELNIRQQISSFRNDYKNLFPHISDEVIQDYLEVCDYNHDLTAQRLTDIDAGSIKKKQKLVIR